MNNQAKIKLEKIKKLKLPEKVRATADKIEKGLSSEDAATQKKAEDALNKLYDQIKAVAAKQREEKTEKEVNEKTIVPQNSDIATPEVKKELTKKTTVADEIIDKALKNDPELSGFGKSDKRRDAGRKALPAGRRVAQKGWANQFGKSDGGRVYYENRENRKDRKSPAYKAGYPFLAKGGKIHPMDEEDGIFYVNLYKTKGDQIISVDEREYNSKASAMTYAMMKRDFMKVGESIFVMNDEGDVLYTSIGTKKMAMGGKFPYQNAQVGDNARVILDNKMGTIMVTYGRRFHLKFPDGSEKTYSAEELEFFPTDEEFAKGGNISGYKLKDIKGRLIEEGDMVKTKQAEGGLMSASEGQVGIVEKTKDAFNNDALLIRFRKTGKNYDTTILLNGQINEIVETGKNSKSATSPTGKYVNKRNVLNLVVKNPNKNGTEKYLSINPKDFLDGLHEFAKGGKLSDDYTYIKRSEVFHVIYRDSKNNEQLNFKPKNGFWVRKKALVDAGMNENKSESKFDVDDIVYNTKTKTLGIVRIADDKYGEVKTDADGNVNVDDLEIYNPFFQKYQNNAKIAPSTKNEIESRELFKPFGNASKVKSINFGTTSLRKGENGWKAKNSVDNYRGYDWEITTMKSMRGDLITRAVGGKTTKREGYSTFEYVMYQDPNITLMTSRPARITDKAVSEQHKKALELFESKVNEKYAKGGFMAKGGEIADFRVVPNKIGQGSLSNIVTADFPMAFNVKGSKQEAEKAAQSFIIENNQTHPTATITKIHPSGQPLKNKKVSYVTKDEISKYADGGYMADGENYEYVNTFKRFDSKVPVPQDDFEKLVDAYHKQLSGDKLAVSKYKVLKLQMGNYLGHKTVEEMVEYIEKTHNAHKMAKGGYVEKFYDKKSDVPFLFKKDEKIKVLQYDGGRLKKMDATIAELYPAEQNDGTYYPFYYIYNSWDEDKKYPVLYSEDELVVRNGNKPSKMAKGGVLKNATYVSKRNINDIKVEINKSIKDLKGADLLDGVYVKNNALKAKFDAYKSYEELSELNGKIWDKYNIQSGSEIYASDSLQKKLALEYIVSGLDDKFKRLTAAQRKKVAEIMTDENEHSLRNYLTLRGYLGQKEYDSYARLYEPKRPYVLNPENFWQGKMAKGGSIGFEGLSKKVAARYEGKNVKAKFQKQYGKTYDKAEAKEVGDKVAAKVYRMQQGKMAMGGKMQGYNDRLDESLSERNNKISKMNASFKARRDESKGENKSVSKRAYSAVKTMDKMAAGGKFELPHQLDKYFTKPAGTIEVEMSKLIPIRARKSGIENAEMYMKKAYDGEMSKRKPIEIYKTRNKKYRVNDGNSTYAVAKKNGWETIYATVVSNPNVSKRAEKSTFTIAKEIRKAGESWSDAVKRVKENRK